MRQECRDVEGPHGRSSAVTWRLQLPLLGVRETTGLPSGSRSNANPSPHRPSPPCLAIGQRTTICVSTNWTLSDLRNVLVAMPRKGHDEEEIVPAAEPAKLHGENGETEHAEVALRRARKARAP